MSTKSTFKKSKFYKFAYYSILFVTLHWSFVAPAQDIFGRYIEIHNLNDWETWTGSEEASVSSLNSSIKEVAKDSNEKKIEATDTFMNDRSVNENDDKSTYKADLNRGKVGKTSQNAMDTPADNVFNVHIDVLPDNFTAKLHYTVKGVKPISVAKSINAEFNTGGYLLVKNDHWEKNTETINLESLKSGRNTIRFNSNKAFGTTFQIKDVEIDIIPKSTANAELNIQNFYRTDHNQVYISGYLSQGMNGMKNSKVVLNDEPINHSNGQFESLLPWDEDTQQALLEVKSSQGIHYQRDISSLSQTEQNIDEFVKRSDFPRKLLLNNVKSSAYEFKVLDQTKDSNFRESLTFSELRAVDINPMNSGLRNIDKRNQGFRLENHSNSKQSIQIKTHLDDTAFNKNHINAEDVGLFYFDNLKKQWVLAERDSLDYSSKILYSKVEINKDSETDYINGIIETPEHPESNAFAPTKISDIKAANPSASVNIMQAPKPSQTGEAKMSYPLELPSGRNGMTPQLALTYNSDAASSWAGYGWSLGTQSISVDSRWGVPKFDASFETEIYNMSGEMLIYENDYLPHRHEDNLSVDLINRTSGPTQFFVRRQQGLVKIERLGASPTNYYWKVTSTNGGISWYGGDDSGLQENAVLRDNNNNIVNWGLYKTEDTYGNYIEYTYDNGEIDDQASNLDNGKYFYLEEIDYTKHDNNSSLGNYKVEIIKHNQIREDPIVKGNLGFKQVDPYLIDEILISHDNEQIRSYVLDYDGEDEGTGRFHKTLLRGLEQFDQNNNSFYKHDFEYYDDLASENMLENGNIYTNENSETLTNDDILNIGSDVQVTSGFFTEDFAQASLINSNESNNLRVGLRPSYGFQFLWPTSSESKFITFGTNIAYSNTKSRGKISLTDIDGDGVSDVVYKSDEGLSYVKGQVNFGTSIDDSDELRLNFTGSPVIDIEGINQFSRSRTEVMPGLNNFDVSLNAFNFSVNLNTAKSTTDVYFTDANNDGLIDIVADGIVHFNFIDNGIPNFTPSSLNTENMLISGGNGIDSNWQDPAENEEETEDEQDELEGEVESLSNYDGVWTWVAPVDGAIETKGYVTLTNEFLVDPSVTSVRLTGETQSDNLNNGIPFRFYNEVISEQTIPFNITQYSSNVTGGIDQTQLLKVTKGQKLFFRAIANEGNPRGVQLNFYIRYLESYKEKFNTNLNFYSPGYNGFLLNDKPVAIEDEADYNDPEFDWDPIEIENAKDDITIQIVQLLPDGTEPHNTVYQKTIFQGTDGTFSPNDDGLSSFGTNGIDEDNESIFVINVISDTNLNYKIQTSNGAYTQNDNFKNIMDWRPVLINGDENLYPIPKHSTFWKMTSMDDINFKYDPNWGTVDGQLVANPTMPSGSIPGINPSDEGQFLFVLEKDGEILKKTLIEVNNANINYDPDNTVFFNGDLSAINPEEEQIRFSYYAVGEENQAFLQNYLEEVGHESSVTLVLDDANTLTTGATEYYDTNKHLGSMIENRGMFFYNQGNADGTMPVDNISRLINEESVFKYEAPQVEDIFPDLDFDSQTSEEDILQEIGLDIPEEGEDGFTQTQIDNLNSQLTNITDDLEFPKVEVLPGSPERFEENGMTDLLRGVIENQFLSANVLSSSQGSQMINPNPSGGGASPGNVNSAIDFEEEALPNSSPDGSNGMRAVDKISRTRTFSTSIGASAGLSGVNVGGNLSYINSIFDYQATNFIDLNGDGYPDNYYTDRIFYTEMTGGHADDPTTMQNNVWDALSYETPGTVKLSGSASSNYIHPSEPGASKTGLPSDLIGVNFDANLINGEKINNAYFMDVNGDGLADRISLDDGTAQVRLNYGKFFDENSSEINFPGLGGNTTEQGESFGVGLNASSELLDTGGLSGNIGIGVTGSSGNTKQTYVDINGDGLVDAINLNDYQFFPSTSINLNLGDRFDSQTINMNTLNSLTLKDDTRTASAAVSARLAYYHAFPIVIVPTPFGPLFLLYQKVGGAAFGNISLSIDKTEKSFQDVNGDGYVDFIESDGSALNIFYSNIKRTNKLKKVTNPINGSFTLDYTPQIKSYDNPNTKWALTHVEVSDDNEFQENKNSKIRTEYTYHNGKYDRREREFLGYEVVKSLQYYYENDEFTFNFYRGTIQLYHNQNYHLSGLLKEKISFRGNEDGSNFLAPPSQDGFVSILPDENIFSRTENTYQLYGFDQNNQIDLNEPLNDDFDSGGQEGRKRTIALLEHTETNYHEFSNQVITNTIDFTYNSRGNIVEYINNGSLNNPDDNYKTTIDYHTDNTLIDNNILSVPSEVKVFDQNDDLRRRRLTSDIDTDTGHIGKIEQEIEQQELAISELEYDQYGNLTKIIYPENQNNQKMSYDFSYEDTEKTYTSSIRDAFEYVSDFEYEFKYGNLLEETDISGNSTSYTYDDNGRLTEVLAPYEADANQNYTIKFEYNLSPDSQDPDFVPYAVSYHYDKFNEGNDIETYTFIDGMNRVAQVKKDISIDGNGESMSVSGWQIYDQFGRSVGVNLPNAEAKDANINKYVNTDLPSVNHPTSVTYDPQDRELVSTNPEGTETEMTYSIADLDGEMLFRTQMTTQQNQNTTVESNSYKDVYSRTINEVMNSEDADDMATTYNYNSIGELLSYTDEEGLTASYTYDNLGRTLTFDHPDQNMIEFEYDKASNLISKTTANLSQNNESIDYKYDFNRLVQINYPQTNGDINLSNVKYKYGTSGNSTGKVIYQEDATGLQSFEYGKLGEITRIERTIVAPNLPVRSFTTSYGYDSWNRISGMIYPDGEKVYYDYDFGGNLINMRNNQEDYIRKINYNKYEQRTLVELGNQTIEVYEYTDEMQRLKTKKVTAANGDPIFDRKYGFDNVGNIIAYSGLADPYEGGDTPENRMGGNYSFEFAYDDLNRLTYSDGNFNGAPEQEEFGNDVTSAFQLNLAYNPSGGIVNKKQGHSQNGDLNADNNYSNNYSYFDENHRVKKIEDSESNDFIAFDYDNNGNMISSYATINNDSQSREYFWDEENRLRVIDDEEIMHHYIYDAGGERVLKSSSNFIEVSENGTVLDSEVTFDNYTTYASPEIVIDAQNNYTKHYFSGSTRVLTRLGGNAEIFAQSQVQPRPGAPIGKKTGDTEQRKPEELKELQKSDLAEYFKKAEKESTPSFKAFDNDSEDEISKEEKEEQLEEETPKSTNTTMAAPTTPTAQAYFYYHADHLGSNEIISDYFGEPHEFHLTLPFGETMVEQRKTQSVYYNSWKFTGKELDEETGLYYYGARYYQPKWSTWLSVDPLLEDYTSWNPYNYVMQNPVILNDPTGMGAEPVYDTEGNHLGNTEEGFTGEVLIYSGDKNVDFSKMSADDAKNMDGVDTYDNQRGNLSGDAKSNIWTNIASNFEGQQVYDETFSMSGLKDDKIHYGGPGGWTSSWSLGSGKGKISGSDTYSYETTVENLASSILVHEWYSHIKKENRNDMKSHRLAYKNVINYKTFWNSTTNEYKGFNMNRLRDYTKKETGRGQVDPLYRNLYKKYSKYSW